jgi:hypothetical protein
VKKPIKKKAINKPAKRPPKKREAKKTESRMQTYIRRQKERGLTNVCIWVPKDHTYQIRKMADDLRREAGIENPRSESLYGFGEDDND